MTAQPPHAQQIVMARTQAIEDQHAIELWERAGDYMLCQFSVRVKDAMRAEGWHLVAIIAPPKVHTCPNCHQDWYCATRRVNGTCSQPDERLCGDCRQNGANE